MKPTLTTLFLAAVGTLVSIGVSIAIIKSKPRFSIRDLDDRTELVFTNRPILMLNNIAVVNLTATEWKMVLSSYAAHIQTNDVIFLLPK